MNLADFTLSALKGFAQEVSTWTNSGVLHSIEGHIAQIENAVATDVHAGETAAKAVLADLYGAFHGQAAEPVEPAPAPAPTVIESNAGAAPVPTPPAAGSAQVTPSPSSAPEAASPAPAEAPTIIGEPGPEVTPPAEPTA